MMLGQSLPMGPGGYLPAAPIQGAPAPYMAAKHMELAAAAVATAGTSSTTAATLTTTAIDRNSPEYLAQLLNDKKMLLFFPNVFQHVDKILEEEINRVRGNLFHLSTNKEPLQLPEENGNVVTLSEKLPVPVKEYPDFNFVGRILGPRGMTAKLLEQDTGCRIMVRGRGSMRDKSKEDQNRGKPNWEHLNEELHVLITVEDTQRRAEIKLNRAVEEVKKLLLPAPEGEDELKKLQLMELAIMNGTYRDGPPPIAMPTISMVSPAAPGTMGTRMLASPALPLPHGAMPHHFVRSAGPGAAMAAGTPIFLAAGPRLQLSPAAAAQYGTSVVSSQQLMGGAGGGGAGMGHGATAIAVSGSGTNGFVYSLDQLMGVQQMFDYQSYENSSAGSIQKIRRTLVTREHPYTR